MTDNDSDKVWVHLFGGEQDGFRRRIALKTKVPKRFFIWHINDTVKLEEVKGKDRMILQNKLAVMAYELFDETKASDGDRELRYRRQESADRIPDPAL